MERKIGEIFIDEDGIKLEVVAGDGCDGCDYCLSVFKCGMCSAVFREDNKSVIFKKVD